MSSRSDCVQGQMYKNYILETPWSTETHLSGTPWRTQKVIYIPDLELNIGEDGSVYKSNSINTFVVNPRITQLINEKLKSKKLDGYNSPNNNRILKQVKEEAANEVATAVQIPKEVLLRIVHIIRSCRMGGQILYRQILKHPDIKTIIHNSNLFKEQVKGRN